MLARLKQMADRNPIDQAAIRQLEAADDAPVNFGDRAVTGPDAQM